MSRCVSCGFAEEVPYEVVKTVNMRTPIYPVLNLGSEFERREFQRIRNLKESPLTTYARKLARAEMINPWSADLRRIYYPVTRYVYLDMLYAMVTGQNRVWAINGATGTLKSSQAMKMAIELDQNGWYETNRGKRHLPKIFWDNHDMLAYVEKEAKVGDCLVLDEEPVVQGIGARSATQAIRNVEMTLRYTEINFIFVFVEEVAHRVHTRFSTRGQHYIAPRMADYGGMHVIQPVYGAGTSILLGIMTMDVPSEPVIQEYKKGKIDFIKGMQRSGGYGSPLDIMRVNQGFIEELAGDEDFLKLKSKTEMINYASSVYHRPEALVRTIIALCGWDEKNQEEDE